jgi:hypothetical protein
MKATGNVGKGLIERFKGLAIGQSCTFPTVLPGIDAEASQAILRESTWNATTEKGYWEFALYWKGIHVADVIAEVVEGELLLEVLA